ncbi:MAG TPA: MarR family transcriptional regulator [Acidimicrobiales bacterium]|nr:MarR family transcriptional regulator [Acidimicrobiales bacterium]
MGVTRTGASAGRSPGDTTTGEIDAALLSVARVMNQVRVHAKLRADAGVDIDRAGAAVLYKLLVESESLRLCDLAERLGIDSPAVTRKVQQLEHLGLVIRSPDPVDGRASRLLLTRDGRRSIERLLGARRVWLEELLSEWPPEDRKEFARLLQLFANTIEHDVEVRHGH